MPSQNPILVSNCCQIEARIPAKKKRNIVRELPGDNGVQCLQAILDKKCVEPITGGIPFRAHAGATDSSIRRGCQTTAACTNAAKIAREKELCV